MSFPISIPFYAFKLRLHPGAHVFAPMNDLEAVRLEPSLKKLAEKYGEKLQTEVLNHGEFYQVLEEYRSGVFTERELDLHFPASKDGFSYPAFEFCIPVFITEQSPAGWWGIAPTLGVTAFGKDEETLVGNLEGVIRLDFVRKDRLIAVQEIVSAIWFESVTIRQSRLKLQAHSLTELEKIAEEEHSNWLSQVAQPLAKSPGQLAYGYEKELAQLSELLRNKFNRNALIVGPNGSGKTTLIWEAARNLKKWNVRGEIWETTASILTKELTKDTGWQHNLGFLCRELADREDLLFVTNLMTLFEVGRYEGNNVSMAEFLYPFLSRGEVNLLSECTEEELAQIELRAPMFTACFRIIRLEQPRDGELEQIILNKVRDIAGASKIRLEQEAIRETIRLTRRFNPYAGMPGQPIRFLESIILNWKGGSDVPINQEVVIRHFCESSGIPELIVNPNRPFLIDRIADNFNHQVFGQAEAVNNVVEAISAVKTALTRTGKPIASFLFLGPTGVGKTELGKVLAEFMFGARNRLVRFDMSEFGNYHSVLRLAGAHPSSEGLLTAAVRKQPFCVLLFDEVEKAHPTFFDLLLQILGEGRLTDGNGKTANFCSSIIIMTSNVGADRQMQAPITFGKQQDSGQVAAVYQRAAEQFFKPELFNRIDRITPFLPIGQSTIHEIVGRELRLFYQREGIKYRRLNLKIRPEVVSWLAEQGFDPKFGARHLQRTLRAKLILPLASQLNLFEAEELLNAEIYLDSRQSLAFDLSSDSESLETWIEELERQNFAEYASNLRRKMAALKASPLYIQFRRDLDRLEALKADNPERFWKDAPKAEWYNTLSRIEEEAKFLHQDIIEKERMQCMACLGQGDFLEDPEALLGAWKSRFFAFQVRLYSTVFVEENHCFLAVFGKDPEGPFKLYNQILKTGNCKINYQSVWFDPGNPEKQGKQHDDPSGEHSNVYNLSNWMENERDFLKKPKPASQLYGIVFRIEAPCAWLYWNKESGFQEWTMPDGQPGRFLIVSSLNDIVPSWGIHRKEIYQKAAVRRTVMDFTMSDKTLPISGACKPEERAGVLKYELDIQFENTLEREIFKPEE